jgi:hypothetical protein
MVVISAKSKRARITALLTLLGVAAIVAVCILAGKGRARQAAGISDNQKRIAYLKSLGWEVDETPVDSQEIVIPKEFPDVYQEYNELQKNQGFDLTEYAGREAMRYSYRVTNYPDQTITVIADIVVYKGQVIAGDIQNNALDGFMKELKPTGK